MGIGIGHWTLGMGIGISSNDADKIDSHQTLHGPWKPRALEPR